MATQSPGARLRETISKVVAIGEAVASTAAQLKEEQAARAVEQAKAGEQGGGSAGVVSGA